MLAFCLKQGWGLPLRGENKAGAAIACFLFGKKAGGLPLLALKENKAGGCH